MTSSDLGVSCDKLCLIDMPKLGRNMTCTYGALHVGQKAEERKKKETGQT